MVTKINQFFGCTVSLIDSPIETDLYVKPTDSHQYLHFSSCHPYHYKKSILYCQALTNFSLRNFFFDIHCNNLEKWLSERRYSEKLVRKEILKARSQSRETLSDKEKMSRNDDRVIFTITYYPVSKNIRIIFEELHILLASDEKHRKVFTDIPRISSKNGKSLKDHLVRSVLPKIDVGGNSGPCVGKRRPCELCKLMKKLQLLKSEILTKFTTYTNHFIATPKTVYLIECNQCWK